MSTRLALCLAAVTSLTACNTSSQLVVGILTNLSVRGQLSRVTLTASRNGVLVDPEAWTISDTSGLDFVLPGSFNYYSRNGGTPVVTLDLQGFLDDTLVVDRQVDVQLSADKELFYRMALVASCKVGSATAASPDGLSCVEGICKPSTVDPRTLPKYQASLVGTVECDSGSSFVDTGTCHTGTCAVIPVTGPGCSADEFCQEGTCYLRNPLQPRSVAFGDTCDAAAGDVCRDAGFFCSTGPGESVARCRQGCNVDTDCTQRLADAMSAGIPATNATCTTGTSNVKSCTYACDPNAPVSSGCEAGTRCLVVTDGASTVAPDCVSRPSAAGTIAVGAACTPAGEENEPCVPGSQCASINNGPTTCYADCRIGDASTCSTTCTGIQTAGSFTSSVWGLCVP